MPKLSFSVTSQLFKAISREYNGIQTPPIYTLLSLEILKPCMFDELIERLEREYLASGRKDHFFHVFTTNAETSSAYAGDDLIFWVVCRPTGKAQFAEVLNASHLVPSRAVVFGNLRFDDDLGVKLAGNNEIGRSDRTPRYVPPASSYDN